MDLAALEVFPNRRPAMPLPASFPSALSRLCASRCGSSAHAHAGVRAGRGHARARPREAARASGRDRHLCGSGAVRTPPFAALWFERGGPARPAIGERKGRRGCTPGPGVSRRSGPAGPRCRGAAFRPVREGPGGARSSAGCAPPLPWRGEAAATGGGDSAPRPPMRLWLCWLGCYTLLLWALRRRMWAGPARYLRSPLSRSLYANMMGSHGPPAPGAGENHQVRPSGLRLPCPALPAPPLPLLAPAGPRGSGAAPREAAGGGRAARGTGGGGGPVPAEGPRAGQRPPGRDKERQRPRPPGEKVDVCAPGERRRAGGEGRPGRAASASRGSAALRGVPGLGEPPCCSSR